MWSGWCTVIGEQRKEMKEDLPNEGKSQKYMSRSKIEPKEETGEQSSKPKFRFKKSIKYL